MPEGKKNGYQKGLVLWTKRFHTPISTAGCTRRRMHAGSALSGNQMQRQPCMGFPLPRAAESAEFDAARAPLQPFTAPCDNHLQGHAPCPPVSCALDSGTAPAMHGGTPQPTEHRSVVQMRCETFGAGENALGGTRLALPCKRKHRWTASESKALKQAVSVHGVDAWTQVAACVRTRSAKQCTEHYHNVVGCAHAMASRKRDAWQA